MSNKITALQTALEKHFSELQTACVCKQLTLEVPATELLAVAKTLRDKPEFAFEQLVDVCGVDYLDYGQVEWQTNQSTNIGFSRGVDEQAGARLKFGDHNHSQALSQPRFAAIYHLLSYKNNHRLRLKVFASNDDEPMVPSVTSIWSSANWYEREAFDLYGILFESHPDLRRILSDYGFIGHPFRKDFPLIGNVEMRYDPDKQRVVYEPVSIEPRVLVPKVIRDDYPAPARNQPASKGGEDA